MNESIEEAIGLYRREQEKTEELETRISELLDHIDELEDEIENLKKKM